MKKPPFKHAVRSRESSLQYSIYAHRQLTRAELYAIIRNYNDVKFNTLSKGHVEIVTLIGFRESGTRQ